jgi:trigger factor
MKVEYTDVTDTRKSLSVEIPSDVVEHEVERVTRDYARSLRLPGFRPGKVPAKVVRQRFKQQILHDVAHDLIPRAVDDALRERGVEPVDAPDVKDVSIDEGRPLTFTAAIETAPPIDPGALDTITLRRPPVSVETGDVDRTLERLRQAQARFEPIEDRGAERGDTLVADMTRRKLAGGDDAPPEALTGVGVEIGAEANPPGFDDQVLGLRVGDQKTFVVTFPADYPVEELAGAEVEYAITVTALRRKVLPEVDDEFATGLGHDSMDALRENIRERLLRDAKRNQEREVRQDLLRQLARRVTVDAPESLVTREIDRRLEEFVRELAGQGVDPRQMQLDWDELRAKQRDTAVETVKCALVLDEIARRGSITADPADVEAEVERFAAQSGRPTETVRAQLVKEGAIGRIFTGLRREKTIDYALARATIVEV